MTRPEMCLAFVLAAAVSPAALAAPAPAMAAPAPASARFQSPVHAVAVRALAARSKVHPGDLVAVAVVLDYRKGFHSWPHKPVVPPAYSGLIPIPTTVAVSSSPPGAEVGEVQWPAPETVRVYYTGSPVDLLSYTGREVVYVPVTLAADQAVGQASVVVHVGYQACDERVCYPPVEEDLTVPLEVVAAGVAASTQVNEPDVFAGFALGGFAPPVERSVPAYINVFGWSFTFRGRCLWGWARPWELSWWRSCWRWLVRWRSCRASMPSAACSRRPGSRRWWAWWWRWRA
ncbi:MAG: protein-disulfide reductase DsbD family protein [Gemmatimonadota bacterium]